MKTKTTLLLILLVSFFSCDKIDELTEINISENFETTFSVSETEDSEGQPGTWSETSTLDIAVNEEIQDNLDLLQSVDVNSLSFEIIDFTGVEGATVSDASLTFGDTVIKIEDTIDLKASDDSNTIFNIGSSIDLNAIAIALKTQPSIVVKAQGTVSGTPVTFDVRIIADITVVIDVI